jgi:ATP-dependent DNA helicase 2 subunit 2
MSPALDALIVAIETQDDHLASKRTWTRKMVLVTDGENPIEVEDLPETINRINDLDISLTIVYVHSRRRCRIFMLFYSGIDFDDEEYGYQEEDKSGIKVLPSFS